MTVDEVMDVFRRVLEVADVGPDSDFFDLGGDSLLGTRVLSAVARATGTELTFDDFLQAATPDALAKRLASEKAGTSDASAKGFALETAAAPDASAKRSALEKAGTPDASAKRSASETAAMPDASAKRLASEAAGRP